MEKQEGQAPPRQAATGAWTDVPKPEKKDYKTSSQESPPGHTMPEELELVPPSPGSPPRRAQPRSVPGLSAGGGDADGALTPGDEAAAPRGAGGGRCTPGGGAADALLYLPASGHPAAASRREEDAVPLPPLLDPVPAPGGASRQERGCGRERGARGADGGGSPREGRPCRHANE